MKIFMGTVLTILALGSQSATAGDKTEEVQFKKGATSATISGSIKGEHAITYKLKANAGQVMSILFAPKNASCYFNLMPPGSDAAIHIGSTSGNEFAGTLGVGGEYKTQVYLMRNAARRNETCDLQHHIRDFRRLWRRADRAPWVRGTTDAEGMRSAGR